jgi:uncharacterized repeat protein (TIGR03803 family)
MRTNLSLPLAVGAASMCAQFGALASPASRAVAGAESSYETHSFPAGRKYGGNPISALIVLPDGSALGTAFDGGKGQKDGSNGGTVYKIAPDRTFQAMHHFTYGGARALLGPLGLTLAADGQIYGITEFGGKGCGGAFRMTTEGKGYKVIHVFNCRTEGTPGNYTWLTQGSDGNFYGTTAYTNRDGGTIFKMNPTGIVTVIHTFVNVNHDGLNPLAGLTLASNGTFYGTTRSGGVHGAGTIFRVSPGDVYEVILNFSGYEGGAASSPPVEWKGHLYGPAAGGETYDAGVVYKTDLDGANYQIVHEFSGGADGGGPIAPLYLARDGKLYGTTFQGGANTHYKALGDGVLFAISDDETFDVLHSFGGSDSDGIDPIATLSQLPDDSFIGSTMNGGTGGSGITYWFTP